MNFLVGGFALLIPLVLLGMYILLALAVQTLAKRMNLDYTWFAWIPILNFYLIGQLVGPFSVFGFSIDQPRYYLPGAYLASALLSDLPIVGGILNASVYAFIMIHFFFFVLLFQCWV